MLTKQFQNQIKKILRIAHDMSYYIRICDENDPNQLDRSVVTSWMR